MAGFFGGTIIVDGRTVKSHGGNRDVIVASFDSSGKALWLEALGGKDAESDVAKDHGNAIAVDSKGNVYVTGSFHGSQAFLGKSPVASKGLNDVFVTSFTSAGQCRWQKAFGGPGDDEGRGIAVDSQDNVYVIGGFQYNVDFGGGPLKATNTQDSFITSFTSTGGYRWQKLLHGTQSVVGQAIAVDDKGHIYVTGRFGGQADLGSSAALSSHGGQDAFVAKLRASDGAFLQRRALGGKAYDVGQAIAVGPKGHVYVTGIFSGQADLGGSSPVRSKDNFATDSFDVFVASLDDQLAFRWQEMLGGQNEDWSQAIAVDARGTVYVTGYFRDRLVYGSQSYTSKGETDIFLWKIVP